MLSDGLESLACHPSTDSPSLPVAHTHTRILTHNQIQTIMTTLTTTELLAVVNNAGILATGEVEFGKSLEPFERQIEVNCLGTIRVTKAFSPLLRRCQTSPRLVNVTSLAARISLPGKSRSPPPSYLLSTFRPPLPTSPPSSTIHLLRAH